MQAFADALKVNTYLEKLWLIESGFTRKGLFAFAEALRVNTVLVDTAFDEKNIGVDTVEVFLGAMQVNTAITTLGINGTVLWLKSNCRGLFCLLFLFLPSFFSPFICVCVCVCVCVYVCVCFGGCKDVHSDSV